MRGETFEDGKIFVGGLSQESTKESMRRHFAEFGNITDCVVMVDNATGRSRGFGFVTFDNAEAIDAVLASKQVLDGKEVDCKRACPRESMSHSSRDTSQGLSNSLNTDKIFVGGLPDVSAEEFKAYFEKYGRVVDAVLMTDKNNNRPRGFGFVTFENPEVVEEVVRNYSSHMLRGKWVEVKKATPKDQMNRGGRSMTGGNLYGGNAGYPKWSYNGYGMDRRGAGNPMYAMYGGNAYYDTYQGGNAYGGDGAGGRSDYASYGRPSPSADSYGQQGLSYTPAMGGGYGVGGGSRGYAPGYGAYDTMGHANAAYNNYGTSAQYAAAAGVYAQHGPQRGNRSVYGRSYPY